MAERGGEGALTAPSLNPRQGTRGKSPHSSVQPWELQPGDGSWKESPALGSKSWVSHPFEFVTMKNEEAECASPRAGSRPLGAAW